MLITIHYAQTLDGRLATRTGDSQWIGGKESLQLAHRLRSEHQAVLVGVGTVIADNPRLTTRLVDGPSPIRVVVDSGLRLPMHAHVLTDGAAPTVIVTTERAPQPRRQAVARPGVEVAVVGADRSGRVDLEQMLRTCERRGIESLLVEGGAAIITALLQARLCDRLVVCIAPRVIGEGIQAVGDLGVDRLRDALTFSSASFAACGEDVIFDGQLARATADVG